MVHEIWLKKISQRENKKKKTKIGKESGQEKINIRVEIYGFIVKIFLGEGGWWISEWMKQRLLSKSWFWYWKLSFCEAKSISILHSNTN